MKKLTEKDRRLWNQAIAAAFDAALKGGTDAYKRWRDEPEWKQPYAANRLYRTASEMLDAIRGQYK